MGRVKNKFSIDTIANMAHDLYDAGKTIGITHGAFDLFHFGHVELLRQSAEQCDYLIVGLESDENVSKYKSYKRPIISEVKRSEILNAIEFPDLIFTNYGKLKDKTYEDLYKKFKVGVVTVGPGHGYSKEVVARAKKLGVKLHKAKAYKEDSTSGIIDSILETYSE